MSFVLKVAYCDYPHARWHEPVQVELSGNATLTNVSQVGYWTHGDDQTSELGMGVARDNIGWIADVAQVKVEDVFSATDDVPDVYAHLRSLEMWVWGGNRHRIDGEVPPLWTVLSVRMVTGEIRTLIVERAWLLNDRGDTIERIAP